MGDQGQLGRKIVERHTFESSLTPRIINFRPPRMNSRFIAAYCGSYHTFLVHESNTVFSFGLNNYGQLGVGEPVEDSSWTAQQVLELDPADGIEMIAGGEHHSMILTSNGKSLSLSLSPRTSCSYLIFYTLGKVYTFGRGDSGQLGHPEKDNEKQNLSTPTLLSGLPENVKSIACGSSFSLAVTQQPNSSDSANDMDSDDEEDRGGNNLYMWGYGEMGQLSNGCMDADEPEQTNLKGRRVLNASAGGQHTVLVIAPKN